MIADEMLVQKAQNGERGAFDVLMQRHQGFVRRALYRFRCFQPYELDDACQEVFIKAFMAIGSFRAESRFTTWIYRILMNYALERIRAKEPLFTVLDESHEGVEGDHSDREDLRRDIQQAFGKITQQQKQVIYLCLLEGYSHTEISKQESMPLGTVKTHALRGRTHLQQALKDWCPSTSREVNYCAVE